MNSLPIYFPLPAQIIPRNNFFGSVTHYRSPNNSPEELIRSVIFPVAMVHSLAVRCAKQWARNSCTAKGPGAQVTCIHHGGSMSQIWPPCCSRLIINPSQFFEGSQANPSDQTHGFSWSTPIHLRTWMLVETFRASNSASSRNILSGPVRETPHIAQYL